MFGMALPCKVLPFKLVVVDIDHNPVRRCLVRLQTEFTAEVAAGISDAAKMAREALLNGEMKSARFDIAAVSAVVELEGDGVQAGRWIDMRGVRAAARIGRGSEDEEPAPEVTLELEGPWADDALVALAYLVQRQATATIHRQQLSLLDKE